MSASLADQSTGTGPESHRSWWLSVVVLALIVAVYFRTWRELWPAWMDTGRTSYTHGLLIAAISGWLVWRARSRFRGIALKPTRSAIPLVLALSLAWLVLAQAGILTLHTVLWPVLAAAAILAACGWRAALALAFPLGYLWFAMPVWDHISRLLQTVTVIAVDVLNSLTRVPAVVVGDMVIIPQGRFEIAAGCSGLHFFVIALAVAVLAGEVHRDRFRTRILLVAIAAALALVANWLRVYFIILAGYLSDMQHYLVTVDHYKFGWVLFAAAMVVFFLILHRLPAQPEQPANRLHAAPRDTDGSRGGYIAGLAAACILPLASFAATQLDRSRHDAVLEAPLVEGFSGPLSPSPVWQPTFIGADAEVRAAYVSASGRVLDYYGNRYLRQAQGHELIGFDNQLLDPAVFRAVQQMRSFHDGATGPLPLVEVTAQLPGGEQWLVMYHYRVAGTLLVSGLATQLTAGFRSLWGVAPAGIHAAAAPCGGDCEAVRRELATLLADMPRNDS